MDCFLFGCWYVLGLIGTILLWSEEMKLDASLRKRFHLYPNTVQWCPTPRVIVWIAAFSFAGPLMILAGLLVYGITYLEVAPPGRFRKWFEKPVCKNYHDQDRGYNGPDDERE